VKARPPTYIVALDPAKRRCGVAVLNTTEGEGVLEYALTLRSGDTLSTSRKVARLIGGLGGKVNLIAEWPVDYASGRSKHKDLVSLRLMVGHVERLTGLKASRVKPFGWKGNLPKAVCERRIEARLTIPERLAMTDTTNDTWDAVGIALWYSGRCARGVR